MIDKMKIKRASWLRRKKAVRAKVRGTKERPRLSVYRSLGHIHAQVINDESGKTLVAASDLEFDAKELAAMTKDAGARKAKVAVAFVIGKTLAEKAKKAGVTAVVFDRGGFAYAGRVAALAAGAREGGLTF